MNTWLSASDFQVTPINNKAINTYSIFFPKVYIHFDHCQQTSTAKMIRLSLLLQNLYFFPKLRLLQ